ncbi:hypothetical protein DENSPDRAFT_881992 [Dentipellis sp. KUC8613]|nr:hypothetical protein DENSPDRAFT_881992 [Dentipellis sp. KUC8613]
MAGPPNKPPVLRLFGPKHAEHKEYEKQQRFEAAHRLHQAIEEGLLQIENIVQDIAEAHNKSPTEISKLLNLTGFVLKQRRRPTVPNAYNHCLARVEDKSWDNDPTKADVITVVKAAASLGGYDKLTPEQQAILTTQLQKDRDAKDTGVVRSQTAQQHDVRTTLNKVQFDLGNVHSRSGLEFFLFCCRNSTAHRVSPTVLSSPAGGDFITQYLQLHPTDTATRFEAFCLNHGGIEAVAAAVATQSGTNKRAGMKKLILEMLHRQLAMLTGNSRARLEWADWDAKLTRTVGIVIEGWPLDTLMSPSNFKVNGEFEAVLKALQSGECRLRQLTKEEKERHAQQDGPWPGTCKPIPVQPSPPASSPSRSSSPRTLSSTPAASSADTASPAGTVSPASSAIGSFKPGGHILSFSADPQPEAIVNNMSNAVSQPPALPCGAEDPRQDSQPGRQASEDRVVEPPSENCVDRPSSESHVNQPPSESSVNQLLLDNRVDQLSSENHADQLPSENHVDQPPLEEDSSGDGAEAQGPGDHAGAGVIHVSNGVDVQEVHAGKQATQEGISLAQQDNGTLLHAGPTSLEAANQCGSLTSSAEGHMHVEQALASFGAPWRSSEAFVENGLTSIGSKRSHDTGDDVGANKMPRLDIHDLFAFPTSLQADVGQAQAFSDRRFGEDVQHNVFPEPRTDATQEPSWVGFLMGGPPPEDSTLGS